MTATTSAYRNLLRELYKSSRFPSPGRHLAVTAHFRAALFGSPYTPNHVENIVAFLRSDRLYKELLEQYRPLHELTQEERVKATARRVGLQTPKSYES